MQMYRKVNRMPMACAKAGARCRKLLCLSTSGTWHNIAGAHESLRMCYHNLSHVSVISHICIEPLEALAS